MWPKFILNNSYAYKTGAILIILGFLSLSNHVHAQEAGAEEEEHLHRKHRISFGIGHAHIPAGRDGDKKKWLNLGAFALDYDYSFSKKWSLGIHSDIVPTEYEVESDKKGESELIRTSPVAAILTGIYKVTDHFGIQAGYGLEMTKEESLSVIRIGAEYGWEIENDWEIGFSVSYDRKIEEYNTWFLGLAISKWLGKPIKK